MTEQHAPRGAGSPLHVHHREDEWFYVLEGELTFWVGGETIVAPRRRLRLRAARRRRTRSSSAPRRARFLLVTEPAGFEDFMRARGRPRRRGPRSRRPPTEPPDLLPLIQLAADHGIEILGPPGIPEATETLPRFVRAA